MYLVAIVLSDMGIYMQSRWAHLPPPHERHGMTHEPSRALPWKSNGLRQSCVCSPDVKLKVPPACQSESQSQLEVSQVRTSLADASRRCSCMKRSHPIPSHSHFHTHSFVSLVEARLSCWEARNACVDHSQLAFLHCLAFLRNKPIGGMFDWYLRTCSSISVGSRGEKLERCMHCGLYSRL